MIKGNACIFPGSLGVACSFILSVSFEGMGCAPVLNLSATPDEAVSIICTVVDKTILLSFGEGWCVWALLLIGQYFSRASCRCSSYNLLLGSFNMVDLRIWDALSRWHISWRVFTPPIACQLFWTGHINSCVLMINYWLLYNQAAC